MASNSNDIKYFKKELEEAIEDGVELFKYYKEISKEFQEQKKILMNNTEFKKDLSNKLSSIREKRKDLLEKTGKKTNMPNKKLTIELVELGSEEKRLKDNKYRQEYEKITEIYLVNSEKKFLKEKEKIRKGKKRILSRIKIALAQLKKKMFKDEFTDFIKYLNGDRYNIANNKQITFKKLMHHLESGEITEEAAKRIKQINELQTINNIDSRKSEIEYEIDKVKKEKKNSKKNMEKKILFKKLIEIKNNIREIFKKNFKGITIPKDLLVIIKMLDQQKSLSEDNKKKVELLKKQLESVVSKIKASS